MTFKERLKELRVTAGLTQAELGRRFGMSSRTIQNYELGDRMPRNLGTVKRITDALGTTLEDLLGNSGLLIVEANEQGGESAAKDITQLVEEVTRLFSWMES